MRCTCEDIREKISPWVTLGCPKCGVGMPDAKPTLRDQFAMAALTGVRWNFAVDKTDAEVYAERAYMIADAMTEARK